MANRKSGAMEGTAVPQDGEVPAGDGPSTETTPPPVDPEAAESPEVTGEDADPTAASRDVGQAAEPVTTAPVEPQEEPHEEQHDEDGGSSFAARALAVLLLLLAGAGIGIWGAPRLAPLLPSGLAPAADWLTPGRQDAETEIAALDAKIDAGLGEVQSGLAALPSGGDIDARIASAVGAAETRIASEIGALQETVGQMGGTELRQRLARVESAIDGQTAELATIKDQLAGSANATGQLSQDAIARIDVYRAELEGLRAEMGSVQDNVSGLSARVDEVAANADRQIEAARTRVSEIQTDADTRLGVAEVDADLALIRGALSGGQPFEESLSRIAAQPNVAVPAGLSVAAPSGVATPAMLRDSYPDAAHAAIRASILAGAGDGVFARWRAFLAAQVASRSLTPQAGEGTDAVLSRMEERLRQDDLDGVLAESDKLPSEAAAAMGGWLAAARLRAEAVDGLAELDSALSATN